MNTIIGNRLKKMRKQKGWSQEIVADKLHISQSAYARIETGESNSWASHLETICWVFEITPQELLKNECLIIGNIGSNNDVGYAEIVNQFSEKLIEEYQVRIREKEEIIRELREQLKKE